MHRSLEIHIEITYGKRQSVIGGGGVETHFIIVSLSVKLHLFLD